MCMDKNYVYRQELCVWTRTMCVDKNYVYRQELCVWTRTMCIGTDLATLPASHRWSWNLLNVRCSRDTSDGAPLILLSFLPFIYECLHTLIFFRFICSLSPIPFTLLSFCFSLNASFLTFFRNLLPSLSYSFFPSPTLAVI